MAEIDGGGLSFTAEMNNDRLNASIAETLRRVQGFSDAVVDSGKVFDTTSQQMLDNARQALQQIGTACNTHEQELALLGEKYDLLGKQANEAFMQGRDKERLALKEQQTAIEGEMKVRQRILAQLHEQSNALEEEVEKLEKSKAETESNAQAHESLRSKIFRLRNEMAAYRAQFGDQTQEYKAMADELGRLQDIQGDIQQQGRILANDQAAFAGVASGLQGIVGGFTAAQGAAALFAGESEDLQKIMLKVQSLMSITMGLQQVSATLNKDSAFSLVTLNKAKEWWNSLLDVGRGKQIAETEATIADTAAQIAHATAQTGDAVATTADTAATEANTKAQMRNTVATGTNAVAQGAQTASAVAGTAANIGLAGAFRMVGAAIKSIPVFGWIVAGISLLIAAVAHFTSKAREAKEAQEEWYKSVSENVYKPVAAITDLQTRWNELGDDFEAKKKFVEENKKAFDDLGVSVKGVTDAENLLSSDAQVRRFVDAQLKKAEAMVYMQEATDKVKKLMEGRQEENSMSKYKSKWVSTSTRGNSSIGYYTKEENPEWRKKHDENEALEAEIKNGYRNAAKAEKEGAKILNDAGIEAANTYKKGSLGAIEEAIRQKQEGLKNLTSNEEYAKKLAEINKLQAQADAIRGKQSGGGSSSGKGGSRGGGSTEDPFLKKLSEYKAEYQRFTKWINSGDKILVQSANREFAGLLQQGATYIDYLKNQRDIILSVDVANRTREQNKQLRQLNDAIAEETRKTVLETFNSELSEQLTNAKTVLEMLNVIEAKRKELANDGTELDNSKKEALDDAEKSATEKLRQETEQLLDEYASYTARKKQIDERYNADVAVLNAQRAKANSDAERAEIDAAIANRKKQYERDSQSSGNTDYDRLLEQYGTFEQRKQQIVEEYAEKRRTAEEMGNQEMIEQINKAEQEALSKFAIRELQASPDWEAMFGDLDEVTTRKLEELIAKINGLDGVYLGIEFDPKDLETIKNKVKEIRDEIKQRNPFKALSQAVKEYSKATDKESKKKGLKEMFSSASGAIDLVKGSMDAIVGGMKQMGIQMDEETEAIIGDLGGIMESASQVSKGLATGNPLSVIQGSISLLTSSFDLFNSKDRKAEKQIKAHKKALDQLTSAYKQLSWEIDRALGGDVYTGQMQAIRNMEEQRTHLKAMWEAEQRKKKTDSGKVKEYQDQYAELGRSIEDMYDAISKDILQTTAKDFAGTLGDALVDAFKKGENASKAFEKTINDVLQNAVANQLKKNFLEKQLKGLLNELQESMGHYVGDTFVFDGLTDAEIDRYKSKAKTIADAYSQQLEAYKEIFKDMSSGSESSLTGSVKGVTEETAGIVAGQLNAVRINQLDATAVLRQSLQALNIIAVNTQYNKYLTKIDRVIALLERSNSDSSLRSQGLS